MTEEGSSSLVQFGLYLRQDVLRAINDSYINCLMFLLNHSILYYSIQVLSREDNVVADINLGLLLIWMLTIKHMLSSFKLKIFSQYRGDAFEVWTVFLLFIFLAFMDH